MVVIECEKCGQTFQVPPSRASRRFCSYECRKNQVTRACAECGVQFTRKASLAGPYCSRACTLKNMPTNPRRPENYVDQTCPGCGVTFTVSRYKFTEYCSRQCRTKAYTDTRECPTCSSTFTFWKSWPRTYCSNECAGKANVSNIVHFAESAYRALCEQCGTKFTTTPKRSRGRFCSRPCWATWMETNAPRGEQAPNWRGGYDPYYGPSWRAARRATRRRDKVCVECGISPETLGKQLDVHHLVPFRTFGRDRHAEANQLDNLVALCPTCHLKLEWATNWSTKAKKPVAGN